MASDKTAEELLEETEAQQQTGGASSSTDVGPTATAIPRGKGRPKARAQALPDPARSASAIRGHQTRRERHQPEGPIDVPTRRVRGQSRPPQ